MITLFIDTHSELLNVSLIIDNNVYTEEVKSINSHSIYLLPTIEKILKNQNVNIKEINRIVVVSGPGSFTGIRIGLTVAKVIAYSLNIPIFTISSLRTYLISSDLKTNKFSYIEDNKGYYISALDENDNILIEESYVKELPNLENYIIVENKLNLSKILKYIENCKPENPHFIKSNYIKKIEVEND